MVVTPLEVTRSPRYVMWLHCWLAEIACGMLGPPDARLPAAEFISACMNTNNSSRTSPDAMYKKTAATSSSSLTWHCLWEHPRRSGGCGTGPAH